MVEEFEKQIPELFGKVLIKDSFSPHSSPAFVVLNHVEQVCEKARMVIDYHQLNKATKNDGYKIPTAGILIDRISLSQPKVFSKSNDGYKIPLTAFNALQGKYEWLVMMFNLKNAPGIFQRKMDNAFKHIRKLTDMLIFSRSDEEHMSHVDEVTDVFKQEGMILSEKKT